MRIKYDDMEKLLAHSELNKRLVLITTRSQRADLKKKKKECFGFLKQIHYLPKLCNVFNGKESQKDFLKNFKALRS